MSQIAIHVIELASPAVQRPAITTVWMMQSRQRAAAGLASQQLTQAADAAVTGSPGGANRAGRSLGVLVCFWPEKVLKKY
jgi:hypothetical protein